MIYEHTAETPYQAWRWAIKTFTSNGLVIDGKKTIDGLIVTEIKHPTDRIEKNPLYKQMFVDEYKKQFVYIGKRGFEYTYADRLAAYPDSDLPPHETFNQIRYIIRELQRNKDSRRAVAITWNPFVDTVKEDVPCLQLVKCVVVRGRLNMEVVFRSHDILKAYYLNVLGLSYLMDWIINEMGGAVSKGSLRVVSMSPHIYLDDADYFKVLTGVKL